MTESPLNLQLQALKQIFDKLPMDKKVCTIEALETVVNSLKSKVKNIEKKELICELDLKPKLVQQRYYMWGNNWVKAINGNEYLLIPFKLNEDLTVEELDVFAVTFLKAIEEKIGRSIETIVYTQDDPNKVVDKE